MSFFPPSIRDFYVLKKFNILTYFPSNNKTMNNKINNNK